MRKNLFRILFVLFLLAVLPPVQTQAAGRDGFRLDESGTVTVVSGHAAKEGISSMSFSLSVESGAAAEFQFVENTAEIQEFRYDRDTRRLNIYLAGTEALFAEGTDSLTVGRIIVRDESGRETGAKVSVVDDSLQYVYGTELKTMGSLELPGTVQIGSGSAPDVDPSPTEAPVPAVTPPAQTQMPDEPDESEDDPEPAQVPVPVPARTPAPLAVKPPAQAQGGTSSPRPTATPPARPQSTGSTSESTGNNAPAAGSEPDPSVSSLPENTPDKEEDGYIFSGLPDEEDAEQTSGSKGVNVLLVVVVIVIIAVIAVEIVAFVVVKKKPKDK